MDKWQNRLYHGDCREVISTLCDEFGGRIRLIYIDPPFFSGTDYTLKKKRSGSRRRAARLEEEETYSDKWKGGLEEYLEFMRECLNPMRELLREDGSLWVHLDWHVSHYIKVMLDEIFGYDNFVNEIVWRRTNSPKSQSRGFGAQHDIILLYTKDNDSFSPKPMYREHDEKSLRPYSYKDEKGRFRLIEIEAHGIQRTEDRKQFEFRGRTAPYLYRLERLEQWWDQGLIYESRNGRYSKKQYLADVEGILVSDLWLDIPPLQGGSKEYIGFSTQKPEALLERIILSASDEGDIVADFFAGSGTTGVVATRLDRNWILCDSSEIAISLFKDRLLTCCDKEKTSFEYLGNRSDHA